MPPLGLLLLSLAAFALGGCRTGRSYPDPRGPRHAGGPSAAPVTAATGPDTLCIVSFNVEFATEIDGAIALLLAEPGLRGADLVLLQEMDEPGSRRIAQALGMSYVYYPALFHLRAQRDFGNAVLSRWPIIDDAKLILPHPSRYAETTRTATAATIRLGPALLRVYSTHLGTTADIGGDARRDQLRAIVDDAVRFPAVVMGGDMNSAGVGEVAERAGFAWPTKVGPRTTLAWRWDHIFLKGLAVPPDSGTGTVLDVHGTSDHRPVWARAIVR